MNHTYRTQPYSESPVTSLGSSIHPSEEHYQRDLINARVLITGAGGYLGTVLIPLLLRAGHSIVAVDRFFFGERLLARHPRITIVNEDTRRLRENLFSGIDAVVDLAAISNDPTAEHFQQETWQINRDARIRNAGLARESGVRTYMLASSCSVYGFVDSGQPCTEQTHRMPLSVYARANAEAEDMIAELADDNFSIKSLRLATLFGLSPRMRFDLVLNIMTYEAFAFERIKIHGDGAQVRPLVHVVDAARAIQYILMLHGRDYPNLINVGADEYNVTIAELAELVSGIFPKSIPIKSSSTCDHRSYQVCFSQLKSLGWRPVMSPQKGVQEILKSLQSGTLRKTPCSVTLDWYTKLASQGGSDSPFALNHAS